MKYGIIVNLGTGWEIHGRRDLTKVQADAQAAKFRLENNVQAHSVLLEKGARSVPVPAPKKGARGKVG